MVPEGDQRVYRAAELADLLGLSIESVTQESFRLRRRRNLSTGE
jgi:predicted nucleotidyltransferase